MIQLHDHHYLLANIKIVEEAVRKGGVKSPKGYLLKAIQNDYRDSKDLQKVEEKHKKQQIEKAEEFKIQELQATKKEWYENMEKKIAELSEEEYASLKEKFLAYVQDNPFFNRVYEEKGFEDKIMQIQWFKFVDMQASNIDINK